MSASAAIGSCCDGGDAEHVAPNVDRATHAVQKDPRAVLVAAGQPCGHFARGRRLEGKRRNGADDHDGEQRRDEGVLVRLEDARERELKDGVEHVREPRRRR